jgi:hypothetical protein
MVLIETLLGAFVRTDRAHGYLLNLDADERQQAIELLSVSEAPAFAAALAFAALHPAAPDLLDRIFRWQPTLVTGLELGVLKASEGSSELVTALVGSSASASEIEKRLRWAATHTDDEHWCAKIKRDYDLTQVSLARDHPHFGLTVSVIGAIDPVTDGRVISIARHAIDYGRTDAVILSFPGGRISMRINGEVFARVNGHDFESSRPLTYELLEQLEATGGALGALVYDIGQQAS